MASRFTRTLLLVLLLALNGQALAAGCEAKASGEMFMPVDMQGDHQSHCSPAANGDCEAHSGNCDQSCGSCPGHCASALPAGDNRVVPPAGNFQATAYREFSSSPEPEAALRPPIHS